MHHPLHLILASFDAKDWVFTGHIARHRQGWLLHMTPDGHVMLENQLLASSPLGMTLMEVLPYLSQHLHLDRTHAVAFDLCKALQAASKPGGWTLSLETKLLVGLAKKGVGFIHHTDLMPIFGPDLTRAFYQTRSLYVPDYLDRSVSLTQNMYRLQVPSTWHDSLDLQRFFHGNAS